MRKIINAEDLPEGDKVYLAKSWDGYRVIHPIKNEDGSINWLNLLVGGKGNMLVLFLYLMLALLFYVGINMLLDSCNHLAEHPCEFCEEYQKGQFNPSEDLAEGVYEQFSITGEIDPGEVVIKNQS